MLLTVLGILISTSCASASLRRLWFAADATGLDAAELTSELRVTKGSSELSNALREEIDREPSAEWERELFAALAAPSNARTALVNEQLAELDYRAQRWARVPRVCASVSSSSGFLLAALAMSAALASDDVDINAALVTAINVVTIGLSGTAFCVAAHVRAGAMTRARLASTDLLVDRLEGWFPADEPDADADAPGARRGGPIR